MEPARRQISWGWGIASLALTCFIWGNSLVPGTGSEQLSLTALDAIRQLLGSWGIPSAWLTNFLVRKAAHFSEYALLGILVFGALRPAVRLKRGSLLLVALILVLVPAVDETIQLFIPGRSGQVSDVLLDCSGAAVGALLHALVARIGTGRGGYEDSDEL